MDGRELIDRAETAERERAEAWKQRDNLLNRIGLVLEPTIDRLLKLVEELRFDIGHCDRRPDEHWAKEIAEIKKALKGGEP